VQTRSPHDGPLGVQQPRLELVPPWSYSSGQDAVDLGTAYGLIADPWQALVLQGALGEEPGGRWASPRVGLLVPRQNGKNGVLELRELAGLILFGERLIIHTAHLLPTALEAFRRVRGFFDNYDDLRKRVKRISQVNGAEGIELLTGQRLLFKARSKSAGRGFSGDCLIFDEAQELSAETFGAALPTLSARPNPQVWLTGTPPGPTTNGEVFERTREQGVAGSDPRLYWAEWSCDAGADLDDRRMWAQSNPALGVRISEHAVANERSAMSDEEFARERLAVWDSASSRQVIDAVTWRKLIVPPFTPTEGEIAYAIDVSPDRTHASIGMAGWTADGRLLVDFVDGRNSADWVVAAADHLYRKNLPRCFVVDKRSAAADFIQPLRDLGVPLVETSASEYGNACARFYDSAMSGLLAQLDQPTLNVALSKASKRDIGTEGLWAWNRKRTESDITPLVAVTLAIHGLSAEVKNGPRKLSEMFAF
jgi:hypothetical protein